MLYQVARDLIFTVANKLMMLADFFLHLQSLERSVNKILLRGRDVVGLTPFRNIGDDKIGKGPKVG